MSVSSPRPTSSLFFFLLLLLLPLCTYSYVDLPAAEQIQEVDAFFDPNAEFNALVDARAAAQLAAQDASFINNEEVTDAQAELSQGEGITTNKKGAVNTDATATVQSCAAAQNTFSPSWDIDAGVILNSATEFCIDPVNQFIYYNSYGNFFWLYRVSLVNKLVDTDWQSTVSPLLTGPVTSCVVDPTNQWVYVSTDAAIQRLPTNGIFNSNNLYIQLTEDAKALTFDFTYTYLYVTLQSQSVQRVQLSTLSVDSSWSSPITIHHGLHVDYLNTFGYFWDPVTSVLRRIRISTGSLDASFSLRHSSSPRYLAFDRSHSILYVGDEQDQIIYRYSLLGDINTPARDWGMKLDAPSLSSSGSIHVAGLNGQYIYMNLMIPDSFSSETNRFIITPGANDCLIATALPAPVTVTDATLPCPALSPADALPQPGQISPEFNSEKEYGPSAAIDVGFWSHVNAPAFLVPDVQLKWVYASTVNKYIINRFSVATGIVDPDWSFARCDYGSPLAIDALNSEFLYCIFDGNVRRVAIAVDSIGATSQFDPTWKVPVVGKVKGLYGNAYHTFIYALVDNELKRIDVASASFSSTFVYNLVSGFGANPNRIKVDDVNNLVYVAADQGVYRFVFNVLGFAVDPRFYLPLSWLNINTAGNQSNALLDIDLDWGGSFLYYMDKTSIRRVDLTVSRSVELSGPELLTSPSTATAYNQYNIDTNFNIALAGSQLNLVMSGDRSALLVSNGINHPGQSAIFRIPLRCDVPITNILQFSPADITKQPTAAPYTGPNINCRDAQATLGRLGPVASTLITNGEVQSFTIDADQRWVYVSNTDTISRYAFPAGAKDGNWFIDESIASTLVQRLWNIVRSWSFSPTIPNRPQQLQIDASSTWLYFVDPARQNLLRRLSVQDGWIDSQFDNLAITGVTSYVLDPSRNSLYYQSSFVVAVRLDTLTLDWSVNPNFYRGAIFISKDFNFLYNFYPGYNLQRYDLKNNKFQNFYPLPPIQTHRVTQAFFTYDSEYIYYADADDSAIYRIDNSGPQPVKDWNFQVSMPQISSMAHISPQMRVCVSYFNSNNIECFPTVSAADQSKCFALTYTWRIDDFYTPQECPVTCDGATQTHVVRCMANDGSEDGTGLGCATLAKPPTPTRQCNTQSCVQWSWSPSGTWLPCPVSCGEGTQIQVYQCVGSSGSVDETGSNCVVEEPAPLLRACEFAACNYSVNCEVGNWEEWGACSALCAPGGHQQRTRPVVVAPWNGGEPCPVLTESRTCNTQACPVDCQVSATPLLSACSATCGPGTQTVTPVIITPASNGGNPCPAVSTQPCSATPCPVDCVVSEWSEFGTCSLPCGGGLQILTRSILTASSYGGAECPSLVKSQVCNTQSCPIDCKELDPILGTCSTSCGYGVQTRTPVYQQPQYGGAACPAVVNTTVPCVQAACPTWQWWPISGWDSCSVTCGSGTQTRSVKCISSHWLWVDNTGVRCGGAATMLPTSQVCTFPACPIDCVVSTWSNWTTCTAQCDGGIQTQTRTILTQPANGGAECPALSRNSTCATQPCPVDCVVSSWSTPTACSATCGGGTQTQSRTVIIAAANNGLACPPLSQTLNCNTQPCPTNCTVGDWGAWSNCSAPCGIGSRSHSRTVTIAAANGGATCPALTESEACNTSPCNADCVLSAWSAPSVCTGACGGGNTQTRTRTIITPAVGNGLPCNASALSETTACNTQPCPVDCVVSDWSSQACPVSCAGGIVFQTRSIVTPASNGGAACPTLNQTVSCNTNACPGDCVMSGWVVSGNCSTQCGGGVQQLMRSVVTPPVGGGQPCPTPSTTQVCNTQPCEVYRWGTPTNWSSCSVSCGGGSKSRATKCISSYLIGGVDDSAFLQPESAHIQDTSAVKCANLTKPPTSQTCNSQTCPASCALSAWNAFGTCAVNCGSGFQWRYRNITAPAANGGSCNEPLAQSQACSVATGCVVDCAVSAWGAWGTCSATCGSGTQSSTRSLVTLPANGGVACPALSRSQPCNTNQCGVSCGVTTWSAWSGCSVSCGGGVQTSQRATSIWDCTPLTSTRACNTKACPVDCVVSDWNTGSNTCSAQCQGGTISATRTVITAAANGGQACPTLSMYISCNTAPCPVYTWANFSAFTPCSSSCNGGIQTRTAQCISTYTSTGAYDPLFTQSNHVVDDTGKLCNGTAPILSQLCNTSPCPINCTVSDWVTTQPCGFNYGIVNLTVCEDQPSVQSNDPVFVQCPTGSLVRIVSALYGRTDNTTCNTGLNMRPEYLKNTNCSLNVTAVVKAKCDGLTNCYVTSLNSDYSDPCVGTYKYTKVRYVCQSADSTKSFTTACGGGVSVQTRSILTTAQFGGAACPILNQTVPCNTMACPQDCRVGAWSAPSVCSAACGGGSLYQNRSITVPASNGGAACPALSQFLPCNTQACPVNCQVSAWSVGVCSATCGGGTQTSTRTIVTPAANGGQACPSLTQVTPCATNLCPADCVMSAWGPWSTCSASCGIGVQTQNRTIITQAVNGGKTCGPLSQSQACNTNLCSINCCQSAWSAWSTCTATCGGGTATRTRVTTQPAVGGGTACGAITETTICNSQACPVNCVLSAWSSYSTCSATCGGGTQSATRSILVPASNGGTACPTASQLVDTRACNTAGCPVDCVVSAWGGPVLNATSQTLVVCENQPPVQSNIPGIAQCPSGYVIRVTSAVYGRSDAATCTNGIDPKYLTNLACFKNVTSIVKARCDNLTTCYVTSLNSDYTDPCVGTFKYTTAKYDCIRSSGAISNPLVSACSTSCGGGTQFQQRVILVAPQNGGRACPPLNQTQACNTQNCPIDCQWTDWSACSITCGNGTQTRSIAVNASFGGAACNLTTSRQCTLSPCPVDCLLSDWSPWGACSSSCAGGTQTSTRVVLRAAANGGAACSTQLSRTQPCNTQQCPIQCVLSSTWVDSSTCSASCGSGTKTQTRAVITQPQYGAPACPVNTQTVYCNVATCPVPVNCALGVPIVSACSVSCGTGTQTVTQVIKTHAANGGTPCPTVLTSTQSCTLCACKQDCMVSDWGQWSTCSSSCGVGSQSQSRWVVSYPISGGAACPALSQTRECNIKACPTDCVMSAWSEWSACSATCNGGTQTRTRTVVSQPTNGGAACPTLTTQSQPCNTAMCTVKVGERVTAHLNVGCARCDKSCSSSERFIKSIQFKHAKNIVLDDLYKSLNCLDTSLSIQLIKVHSVRVSPPSVTRNCRCSSSKASSISWNVLGSSARSNTDKLAAAIKTTTTINLVTDRDDDDDRDQHRKAARRTDIDVTIVNRVTLYQCPATQQYTTELTC